MSLRLFIPILVLTGLGFSLPFGNPEFSYDTYGNIANYFEDEDDFKRFFNFKRGQTIAEVGAYKGQNICGIALMADSLNLYAQDINAEVLNERSLNKQVDKIKKYRNPLTSKIQLCIGTEKSTNLPDNSFDKIILSSTFHEFTYMGEMLADIHKKLKPGGRLYILESQCDAKGHKNYANHEAIALLEKAGFKLLKRDGKDLNGSTGLYRLVVEK